MAVRTILEYPDPRLGLPSVDVELFDDSTACVAQDLIETLHAHQSVGLCAAQIDVRQKILVMDHTSDQSAAEVYINPSVLKKSAYGLVEERCLSVPDIKVNVFRATEVLVRAQDETGNPFERQLSGMPAVCLQHEMDHFNGKLLVDRLNWFRKRKLRAAMRSGQAA